MTEPTQKKRGRPSKADLLERELADQKELVAKLKAEIAEAPEPVEGDATVLYDPYQSQRAFRVMGQLPATQEFPEGQTLSWKSATYRDRRGWRGWIPLQYGDEYTGKTGEKLSEYIDDPPRRMPLQTDSYVRRGDMILCRLDTRMYNARQATRTIKAARQQGLGEEEARQVGLSGVGAREDLRPRSGNTRKPGDIRGRTADLPSTQED